MNRRYKTAGIACVLAGFAAPAAALNLSTNGLGEALIFPYYTVNKNLDTYVSISNAAPYAIVAKVRFLDGRNGRPVADFNLYLSAHDTWAAAVTRSADGTTPVLKTTDHSCTSPAIPAAGLLFTTAGFDGSGVLPADDGPHDISRTREGSIEVIAGGSVIDGSPTALAITQAAAGTPNAGQPPGCASLPGSLFDDIVAPDNSLSGAGAVIDVSAGQYYAYSPEAIASLTHRALFAATNGPLEPSLAQANSSSIAGDGSSTTAYFFADDAAVPNGGRVQTFDFPYGIDAVSAIFMADSLSNDYDLESNLGANTDWILTSPTRRFYVDPVYAIGGGWASTVVTLGGAASVFDRDHSSALPSGPVLFPLPYNNVNVIGFLPTPGTTPAQGSGVFGSQLASTVAPTAEAGVMRLDFSAPGGRSMPVGPLVVLYGTPMTGFAASNIINANAQPGRLANYGATFRHRTTACRGFGAEFFICQR